MVRNSRLISTSLCFLLAVGVGSNAQAQYPNKPIELIVPWPAGVSADVSARVLSQALSKRLGVAVQVVNKPGAAAVAGTAEFVKSKPDGYTLGAVNIGPAVGQIISGAAPYGFEDMVPIGLFNEVTFVVAAKSDAPYKTMKELAAHAARSSKEMLVGVYGPGPVPTQTLVRMAGTDGWKPKLVTFPAPGWSQLQAGDADIVTVDYLGIAGQLKANQAQALVVIASARLPGLPDVPTVREAGYGFGGSVWTGLFAPKDTPHDVVDKLAAALREAIADPSIADFAAKSGTLWSFVGPADAKARIQADTAWLTPVMTELGLVKKKP